MMHRYTFKRIVWCVSLFSICSSQAAILTVTNLLDDGSNGSLRTTIDQASAGDTIVFDVSGTIFLDAANGALLVTKPLTINGAQQITIDGGDAIDTGFHITASGKNSTLRALTIQNFSDTEGSEPTDVHGILIDAGASGCTIQQCVVQTISGTGSTPQTVYGIRVLDDFTMIDNNQIQLIFSTQRLTDNSADVVALYAETSTADRCTHNTIAFLSTGDALQHTSGSITGIVLSGIIQCFSDNTVTNCTSGQGYHSGNVAGMRVETESTICANNTVTHLASGIAAHTSGNILGLFVRSVCGDCVRNTIIDLQSAPALYPGEVVGLSVTDANAHIFKNHLSELTVGEGIFRKAARGILVDFVSANNQISCNIVTTVCGGEGEPQFAPNNTVGLYVRHADHITIQGNTISSITGDNGQFTTGIQIGWAEEDDTVTNSSINDNTFHTITDVSSGYGVTIINQNSHGNTVLSNSIFATTGKAINILGNSFNGDDISAFSDGVVLLMASNCTNRGKIELVGEIIPGMGLNGLPFLLQFFVSDTNPPAAARTLIYELTIDTSQSTQFSIKFTPLVATQFGQYLTATATALPEPPVHNWNTSEVSNALSACNSSGSPYSPFICPEVPTPHPPVNCENCPFIPSNSDVSDIL